VLKNILRSWRYLEIQNIRYNSPLIENCIQEEMSLCYVTAFIDLGRENWTNFPRTFDVYLKAFLPYLTLFRQSRDSGEDQNCEMIVYVDVKHYAVVQEHIEPGLPVRIISVDQTFLNENIPLWSRLDREKEIMESDAFRHRFPNRLGYPEHSNPRYTLVNHAKVDFIAHATTLTDADWFCWSDFGYFHKEAFIPDRLVDIGKLESGKVNYTLINKLEDIDRDAFYTIHYAPEKIGGFFFAGERDVMLEYQKLYHDTHAWFQENGIADDDQHVALQAYFNRSDLFHLHYHGVWHSALIAFQKDNNLGKYSIVLPMKIDAGNGFRIFTEMGLKSYEKYLDIRNVHEFLIISPATDIASIYDMVKDSHIPFRVIDENEIIPSSDHIGGWYKQQFIKMLAARFVTTSCYLVVDSDMYLTQHLLYTDLVHDGKVKYTSEEWPKQNGPDYAQNTSWWESSCCVLDYSVEDLYQSKDLMSVTPVIFITTLMLKLLDKLKEKYGESWINDLHEVGFTEFTLYWIFLIQCEMTTLYTNEGFPLWKLSLEHSVIDYSNITEVVVQNSFVSPASHFAVIQGYLSADITPLIKMGVKCLDRPDTGPIVLVAAMLKPQRYQSFSVEERHQHLLGTVKSARERIPGCVCILIEGSKLDTVQIEDYRAVFDHVLLPAGDPSIDRLVNHPTYPGVGECALLSLGVHYLKTHLLPSINPSCIMKLGGRYTLTDDFSLSRFSTNLFTFCTRYDESVNEDVYITKLYTVPVRYVDIFSTFLDSAEANHHKYPVTEMMYRKGIPSSLVHTIDRLGIQGNLSYNGNYFHD